MNKNLSFKKSPRNSKNTPWKHIYGVYNNGKKIGTLILHVVSPTEEMCNTKVSTKSVYIEKIHLYETQRSKGFGDKIISFVETKYNSPIFLNAYNIKKVVDFYKRNGFKERDSFFSTEDNQGLVLMTKNLVCKKASDWTQIAPTWIVWQSKKTKRPQ